MSIKGLWAAFKVYRFFQEMAEEAKQEGKKMGSIKDGIKTSEFWLTVFTAAGTLVGQMKGVIPEPWGAIVAAVVTCGYQITRTLAKKG